MEEIFSLNSRDSLLTLVELWSCLAVHKEDLYIPSDLSNSNKASMC